MNQVVVEPQWKAAFNKLKGYDKERRNRRAKRYNAIDVDTQTQDVITYGLETQRLPRGSVDEIILALQQVLSSMRWCSIEARRVVMEDSEFLDFSRYADPQIFAAPTAIYRLMWLIQTDPFYRMPHQTSTQRKTEFEIEWAQLNSKTLVHLFTVKENGEAKARFDLFIREE